MSKNQIWLVNKALPEADTDRVCWTLHIWPNALKRERETNWQTTKHTPR